MTLHAAAAGFDRRPATVDPDLPSPRADAARVLLTFLAFGAGAVLSWESFGSWKGPSFFYPAAGVGIAAMILNRRALWPWLAVAVIAAEVLVDVMYGTQLWVTAVCGLANAVESVVGASLVLAWCGGRPDLRRRRDLAAFIAGACLIAPMISGLVGGTLLTIHHSAVWPHAVATWWSGDALGILVMASPILLWSTQSDVVRRRPWEFVVVLALTAALSVATLWTDVLPSILILPILAWAAFRLDMLGASIAGAVAAILANVMTTHGRGMFADTGASPGLQVIITQIYVAVLVVVALLIAQEASARLSAVRERELERRERIRLETLSALARQLAAALTPEDVGAALKDQVLNDAGASALSVGVVNTETQKLDWITASGYSQAVVDYNRGGTDLNKAGMAAEVFRTGRPLRIGSKAEFIAAYPEKAQLARQSQAESIATWPLAARGAPFGVLQLLWSEPQPFDEAQLAYGSAVAGMVSQALVRAKLYDDERARADALHSVAQPLAGVDAVGLEYCVLYKPADAARGLGGDWYSVMALPGRRTYLAVGDVIGHGLLSVEDMAQLRTAGNAYAHLGLSPDRILTELNRFAEHQIAGEFASTLVVIFDPDEGTLSYSSAGHLPALLRKARSGEVIRLSDASGPLLGPFEDAGYEHASLLVEDDDVLVMYTDGLVEHYDADLNTGIGHLEKVIENFPPAALLDCEALARDVAPDIHLDDLCLLIVRFGSATED